MEKSTNINPIWIQSLTDSIRKELQEETNQLKDEIKKLKLRLNIDNKEELRNEKENKRPESSTDETSKDNKELTVTITYEEALRQLGGEEEIKKFMGKSEALYSKICNVTLEEEICKIMPPTIDWKSFSTKLINQPYINDIDELYDHAESVYESFKEILHELGTETKSKALVPPMKSKERAENKAKFKYRDHDGTGVAYYRITDIVRATLEFSDIESMYDGVEKVMNIPVFTVKEFNDRYQSPKPGGYRDIQMVVEFQGHMCEIQLSTEVMRQAKETTGHRDYEVYRELLAAVTDRDLSRVRAALDFGRQVLGSNMKSDFMRDENCRLLPHEAAKNGETEILDCLLENGADPDAQDKLGETPLHHAVYNGHNRSVWLLLSKYQCNTNICNNNDETALLKGYFMLYSDPPESHRRAMVTLLQAVDIDQVKKTVKMKDKMLKQRFTNSRLLVDFAADGDVEKMEELLKQFNDPNSTHLGETALQAAIRGGHKEAVELLLKFNVSTNTGEGQKLIVQEALDEDQDDIAILLRDSGANIQGTTWRLLVKYAWEGNLVEIKKLLEKGVNISSMKNGLTALKAGVQKNHLETVKLLLKYHTEKDKDFIDEAIIEAEKLGNDEMKSVLLDPSALGLPTVESITFEQAANKLGGVKEIKRYERKSKELCAHCADAIIEKKVKSILPPITDWSTCSTQVIHQPYSKNLDDLYVKADSVRGEFEKLLQDLAEQTESKAIIVPLKDKERAESKAKFLYKNPDNDTIGFFLLTDIVRGALEFPNIASMYDGLETIMNYSTFLVRGCEDYYQNPLDCGFRGIIVVVELDGFMCELALNTTPMFQAMLTTGHRNSQVYIELCAAIKDRDISRVESILEFGKTVLGSGVRRYFMRDEYFRLLPHQAAKNGELKILDLLLDCDGDPNVQDESGETPLHHAVCNGHECCVWLLLSKYNCRTNIRNNSNETAPLKGFFMLYSGQPKYYRSVFTLLNWLEDEEFDQFRNQKDKKLRSRLNNNSLFHCTNEHLSGNCKIDQMKETLQLFRVRNLNNQDFNI